MSSTGFPQVVDVVEQNIIFQHLVALRYKKHKAILDTHNQGSCTPNGTQKRPQYKR
jgi:hypothetical protein